MARLFQYLCVVITCIFILISLSHGLFATKDWDYRQQKLSDDTQSFYYIDSDGVMQHCKLRDFHYLSYDYWWCKPFGVTPTPTANPYIRYGGN